MEKKKVKRYTRREVRRNRMIAFCCLVVLAILLIALIVWGIIQTMAFTSIPQRQEFTPFLNYPTLQKKLIPTKKYSNSKQTPNFTFSGVKLGACFVKY